MGIDLTKQGIPSQRQCTIVCRFPTCKCTPEYFLFEILWDFEWGLDVEVADPKSSIRIWRDGEFSLRTHALKTDSARW